MSEECAHGIALWSDAPTVAPLLPTYFHKYPAHEGVYCSSGAGFFQDVENFLDSLSQIERQSIKGVPIYKGVEPNGWHSERVDAVLTKLRTPWLPSLLNEEKLTFHYQPIVSAESMELHGYEALMRTCPGEVSRSPHQLIEAARAHRALLKLDQIARRQAILQGGAKLRPEETLFVNFMPLTIYNPDVCLRTTFQAIKDSGIDIHNIVFEVIESEEFPDIHHLGRILKAYRDQGARIALDDLGSGNTAMTFIDQLHPDIIKIDREIIRLAAAKGESSMLLGMIGHAKAMGISVLAEGVETAEELRVVQEMGVDLIQGWYIGKPAAHPVRKLGVPVERRRAA